MLFDLIFKCRFLVPVLSTNKVIGLEPRNGHCWQAPLGDSLHLIVWELYHREKSKDPNLLHHNQASYLCPDKNLSNYCYWPGDSESVKKYVVHSLCQITW